ncbi:MAG: glycosyltransferase [Phycisphaerales bacterium]|nr:glycosyltransferase [Phycisphaerales bacterium]
MAYTPRRFAPATFPIENPAAQPICAAMPRVSVLLPVSTAPTTLARAAECILRQTHTDLELLLILNGSDSPTRSAAVTIGASDARVRLLELPSPSLPAALNVGLRAAAHELVARMDADDTCPPTRIARQVAFLTAHPEVVALGTAFERALPDGAVLETLSPPTHPERLRWSLVLDNAFCHGSMMLRRAPVLDLGGYDESLDRAQDYDLWLRLSRVAPLANLRDVLYRYTVPSASAAGIPTARQAQVVASRLIQSWAALPPLDSAVSLTAVQTAVDRAHAGGFAAAAATGDLATILDQTGPALEPLIAFLLASVRTGVAPSPIIHSGKLARLRFVGGSLRAKGVAAVTLYGAGAHSGFILDHLPALGLQVTGLCDDQLVGARWGLSIAPPHAVPPGTHVLLSSDWHEPQLWTASAPMRARGVNVWPLYLDYQDGPSL